jgi:hypothetical protein
VEDSGHRETVLEGKMKRERVSKLCVCLCASVCEQEIDTECVYIYFIECVSK